MEVFRNVSGLQMLSSAFISRSLIDACLTYVAVNITCSGIEPDRFVVALFMHANKVEA